MFTFITKDLIRKLIASYVLVAVLPILLVGYLAFDSARSTLKKTEFNKLISERDLQKKEIKSYFHETIQNLRFLVAIPTVRTIAESFISYLEYGKRSKDANFNTKSDLYIQLYNQANPFFQSFMEEHPTDVMGYQDMLIINASDGVVMYSTQKLADLGANLKKGELSKSGLGLLWDRVMKTQGSAMVDYTIYQVTGKPGAFIGVPIRGTDEEIIGVLALRIGLERIDAIFHKEDAEGHVRAYLVGTDHLIRSGQATDKASGALTQKMETEAVLKALDNISGADITEEDSGASVMSAYAPVGLKTEADLNADFDWAIVAEIPVHEAFRSASALGVRVAWIAIVIGSIVLFIAYFVARGIARPLIDVSKLASQIRQGDLNLEVHESKRKDQIGDLVNGFSAMATDLSTQIGGLREMVSILNSSYSDISTTVSQVAESASKTSAAVSETTTTVEQVKQSTALAIDRAKSVARNSASAVEVSESGAKATEGTIERMTVIQEQMNSIGETVVRLSEHSAKIEQIIVSVQDLADQSNLLAVNASIEAARAGDAGKGFTVVANEIKSLADQSKEATKHIHIILDETRKWVSEAVLATEQGTKAVQAGVEQSLLAGESIRQLARTVEESAQEASVIESSSEQQFAGVDQIASAMISIDLAIKQNLDGVKQLEAAAIQIEGLGMGLKEFVQHYKVKD